MGGHTRPGGPLVSSAKKRRLAALEQRSAAPPPAKRPATASSAGGAAPSAVPSQPSTSQLNQQPYITRPESSTALSSGGDHVYAPLLDAAASGPVAASLGLAIDGSLSGMLEELMVTNRRASNAKSIVGGKLRDKTLLLDNPAVQRHQGRRSGGGPTLTAKLASRKEQRRQGLCDLKNASNLTFSSLQDLHRQWKEYIHALALPAQNLKEVQQLLLQADLHGCFLRVAQAPEPRLVGVRGIVVRNTQNTFFLVTPDDRLVVIPKKPCVFEYSVDDKRVVTLLGSGLAVAAAGEQAGGNGKSAAKKKKK